MLVDVAHASAATIDDVLAIATRPVVASHTGVRGVADNARNLSDDARCAGSPRPAASSGSGSGRPPAAATTSAAIARSISYAVDVAGVEHVGLGSDFDGAVPVPFDATGLVQLTDALLDAGLEDDDDRARSWAATRSALLAEALP